MALRRVRSKSTPAFESVASDEWIERYPDDWEVLDDGAETPAPVVELRADGRATTRIPTSNDDDLFNR